MQKTEILIKKKFSFKSHSHAEYREITMELSND